MSDASPASLRGLDPDKLEAVIELMFLAAHADDEFSDEERNEFANNVADMSQRRIVGDAFRKLMARIESDLQTSGRTARLSVLRQSLSDPQMRLDALALAIRMTAADGVIRTSERELILEVAEAMEIDGSVAADLVTELSRKLK